MSVREIVYQASWVALETECLMERAREGEIYPVEGEEDALEWPISLKRPRSSEDSKSKKIFRRTFPEMRSNRSSSAYFSQALSKWMVDRGYDKASFIHMSKKFQWIENQSTWDEMHKRAEKGLVYFYLNRDGKIPIFDDSLMGKRYAEIYEEMVRLDDQRRSYNASYDQLLSGKTFAFMAFLAEMIFTSDDAFNREGCDAVFLLLKTPLAVVIEEERRSLILNIVERLIHDEAFRASFMESFELVGETFCQDLEHQTDQAPTSWEVRQVLLMALFSPPSAFKETDPLTAAFISTLYNQQTHLVLNFLIQAIRQGSFTFKDQEIPLQQAEDAFSLPFLEIQEKTWIKRLFPNVQRIGFCMFKFILAHSENDSTMDAFEKISSVFQEDQTQIKRVSFSSISIYGFFNQLCLQLKSLHRSNPEFFVHENLQVLIQLSHFPVFILNPFHFKHFWDNEDSGEKMVYYFKDPVERVRKRHPYFQAEEILHQALGKTRGDEIYEKCCKDLSRNTAVKAFRELIKPFLTDEEHERLDASINEVMTKISYYDFKKRIGSRGNFPALKELLPSCASFKIDWQTLNPNSRFSAGGWARFLQRTILRAGYYMEYYKLEKFVCEQFNIPQIVELGNWTESVEQQEDKHYSRVILKYDSIHERAVLYQKCSGKEKPLEPFWNRKIEAELLFLKEH